MSKTNNTFLCQTPLSIAVPLHPASGGHSKLPETVTLNESFQLSRLDKIQGESKRESMPTFAKVHNWKVLLFNKFYITVCHGKCLLGL